MTVEEIRARYGDRIAWLQAAAHRCPERGMEEFETSALIRGALLPLGLEEIPLGLPTGVAFRLRTGKDGPITGLRADIDGLPVEEAPEHKVRSEHPGMMHACGHDVHIAGLYGAALALSAARESLAGDVVFLFQPAEETTFGARAVLDAGLLDRVPIESMFGLHNMPSMPVGTIGVRQGPLMAAKDSFVLTIHGRGGHGAVPEECCDPIVAAAAVISAFQTIVSRNVAALDSAVISVCSIHGGSADNRIEDDVTMTGGVRTLRIETRALVQRRMREMAEHCAAAYGCTATLTFEDSASPLINAAALLPDAMRAAQRTVPEAQIVRPEPAMISEDFADYCNRLPSFFFFIGSGAAMDGGDTGVGAAHASADAAPLHSAQYLAHADTALYGAALLANTVPVAAAPAESTASAVPDGSGR